MDYEVLRKLVRETYPFPIAHAHKKTVGLLDDGAQKLKCILGTAESTMQFLGLTALAQLRRDVKLRQAPEQAALDAFSPVERRGETRPQGPMTSIRQHEPGQSRATFQFTGSALLRYFTNRSSVIFPQAGTRNQISHTCFAHDTEFLQDWRSVYAFGSNLWLCLCNLHLED